MSKECLTETNHIVILVLSVTSTMETTLTAAITKVLSEAEDQVQQTLLLMTK